jgi:hypothetical protein
MILAICEPRASPTIGGKEVTKVSDCRGRKTLNNSVGPLEYITLKFSITSLENIIS